ncbi:MAG: glycosyltransferase family 39 protein [Patescibacteria group bacterium]|nr:glycosyltransferase family 39 protein [Patescibacteria group bacterium]
MEHFLVKYHKIILVAIIILAAGLIFFGLTRADIQIDDATYSFRSLGYLDYMASQLQTTPLQWFDSLPTWSHLSFHDSPPLVFIIQFIFFKIFGATVLAARLPFALAGLVSIYLTYLIGKKLFGESVGLLSALILTISSYHIWASKVGYLEPMALAFILLTLYLFLVSLDNHKFFILLGVALGLMFLTKYTTLFVLPAILIYLLIVNKKLLANKYSISGAVIAIFLFSPVIYYNVKTFQTRGHLDLQLTKLFGQSMADWPGLAADSTNHNYLKQGIQFWSDLMVSSSLPFYLLMMLSVVYLFFIAAKKYQNKKYLFLPLLITFITLQFSVIGSAVRFSSIINPFLAITLALAIVEIYHWLIRGEQNKPLVLGFTAILFIIFAFELFYNLNTNIFLEPVGEKGKFYSIYRWESLGFNQLNQYLVDNEGLKFSFAHPIKSKNDIKLDFSNIPNSQIFVFDPDLNWFSTLWYFTRYTVYSGNYFLSASDLAIFFKDSNWLDFFKKIGVKNVYFIRGVDNKTKNELNEASSSKLEAIFLSAGATEHDINNINRKVSIKLYKLTFNQ